MPDFRKRMEELLFDYGTTYRTDFRNGEIVSYPKTEYKAKVRKPRGTFTPLKDIHTLTEFTIPIPFDLLHTPKDIIRTNPWVVQQPCSRLPDLDREKVQQTRPRLVMTPALSMDDIQDPRARKLLIEDVYVSDMARGLQEAVSEVYNIRAPFPGIPEQSNPICLPSLQPPVVPREWRKDTLLWDRRQVRGYCDSTKNFWLLRDKPKCSACDTSAVVQEQKVQLQKLKGELCKN